MAGKPLAPVHRLRWFKDARFGMFITWGLYSQLGRWEGRNTRMRAAAR